MTHFLISDAHASNTASSQQTVGEEAIEMVGAEPYELSAEKMMMDNMLILGMLFFIFYFILIRPQQRRARVHQEMMKGLKKKDKIITTGGLIGTIAKFEGDDVVVVEIANDIKVHVARGSISEVVTDSSKSKGANDN